MNIAIDIDDTLTNSFEYFMGFIAEYFNIPIEVLDKKNISYNTLPDDMKIKAIEFGTKYYEDKIIDTPFKQNAVKIVNKLYDLGHKIYIITARPKPLFIHPYEVTKLELEKNNLKYDQLFCELDKKAVAKKINADVFIDDSIKNCMSVSELNIPVYLFTSRANKDTTTTLPRINNWLEGFKTILSLDKNNK